MEKSLDQLIEHLLAELALCGPAGASVAELTAFVDDFYYGANNNDPSARSVTQIIDDPFIASVWAWLGRHPDVSIGSNKEHNKTPLFTIANSDSSLSQQSTTLPRVSVTDDRIYQAICGHPRDDKRVFKSEYGLLLVIAAARSDGILQGELGRVAGQDKRSVPKRTDSLRAKGYVIKEESILRGAKSSRLTLRRFASPAQLARATINTTDGASTGRQERAVQDVVNDIVRVIAEATLVEADELANRVKMSAMVAHKALLKIIRILGKDGYVKKTKAAVGASAHTGEPKVCFRRLRDFVDADLNGFAGTIFDLARPIREVLEDIDEGAPDDTNDATGDGQALVQWNLDRSMPNALQQAIELARSHGISMSGVRDLIGGQTMKRTVDACLARISFASLLTQPAHLRHLAVVRTNKGVSGGPIYVHHSFAAFAGRLKKGNADAASVVGANKVLRESRQATEQSTATVNADTDAFGFPLLPKTSLVGNGTATLADFIRFTSAEDIGGYQDETSDSDHRRRKRRAPRVQSLGAIIPTPPISDRTGRPKRKYEWKQPRNTQKQEEEGVVRGRPRKFLAGTEKFWQIQFWHAKVDAEGPGAGRSGVMSHPAGLSLFKNRPHMFDETLVKARQAHLPLPKSRDDICEAWIKQTEKVLQRDLSGAYVTPVGVHLSKVQHKSQILIIRSKKLSSLDFREQPKIYAYRFLSSMVAHSSQAWRWYPTQPPPNKRAKPSLPRRLDVEYPDELLEAFGRLPRMGVFYRASTTSPSLAPQGQDFQVPKTSAEELRELMAETDVDSEVERQEREQSKTDATIQAAATVQTSPAEQPKTSRGIRGASFSDAGSINDQLGSIDNTPLKQRSTRHRRPTQRASEGMGLQARATSVGSASVLSDTDAASTDGVAPFAGEESLTLNDQLQLRQLHGQDVNAHSEDALQPQSASASNRQGWPATTSIKLGTAIETSSPSAPSGQPPEQTDAGMSSIENTAVDKLSRGQSATASLQEKRAKLLSQPGARGVTGFCRKALLGLLDDSGGAAPKDLGLLRKVCIEHWHKEGQPGLPTVAAVRSSVQGLINAGLLKSHTFTFRNKLGILQSGSIVFLPELSITDQPVEDLKQGIMHANAGQYIPPQWQEISRAAEKRERPSSLAIQDEEKTLSEPQNDTPLSEETGSPSAPESPKSSHAPARRESLRTPRRTTRRRSSASRGSRSVSISPSPTTGFLSLRSSRSSSISEASSSKGVDSSGPNVGFLTLKVPRLGTLPQVQQFNANLQIPEHLKTVPAPPAAPAVPKKPRKPRATRARRESTLQKIIWKKPRAPRSLDELLAEQYEHDGVVRFDPSHDADQNFFNLVQAVQIWEERLVDKLIETKAPWTFIDHTAAPVHFLPLPRLQTWHRVLYTADGEVSQSEIVNVESWLPFVQALEKSRLEPGLEAPLSTPSSKGRVTRQDTGSIRQKRRFDFADVDIWDDRPRKRSRRRAADSDEDEDEVGDEARLKRPYKRKRGNPIESQHSSILAKTTNEDIFRITVTVLLARTLAGGTEKTIDWTIVNKMNPNLLRSTIMSRWKAVDFTFPEEVSSLVRSIRTLYLEAVEASELPLINFTSPQDSPWEVIVAWALEVLPNFLNESVLPSSRKELLARYSLTYIDPHNIRPLVVPGATMRTSEREEHIVNVPFGISLIGPRPAQELVDSARSLVLSTLLTPDFTLHTSRLATQQLAAISSDRNTAEQATAVALQDLLSEQTISKTITALKRLPALLENNQRSYRLTEKLDEWLETKRIIHRGLLAEALEYKNDVLDEVFSLDEMVTVPNQGQVTNGQMAAICNLLNSGMIRIRPGPGSVKSRFGVAWERVGYQSKQLEAHDLGFAITLERTASYFFGDDGGMARGDAPRKGANGEWPMWMDINGEILVDTWEKVLAAVVGIASIRPGVQVMEVRDMLGGILTQSEILAVLEWAQKHDFVTRTLGGAGWETRDSWWLCLGRDADWGYRT